MNRLAHNVVTDYVTEYATDYAANIAAGFGNCLLILIVSALLAVSADLAVASQQDPLVAGSSAAGAAPAAQVQLFRHEAHLIIEAAMANGVQEVGGVNLAKLNSDIDQLQIGVLPKNFKIRIDNRESAQCVSWSDLRMVNLNASVFEKYQGEQLGMLAVHESICALYNKDKDYAISTEIWMKSKSRNKFDSDLFAQGQKNIQIARGGRGGSTSVGGGGDGDDIRFRQETIAEINTHDNGPNAEIYDMPLSIYYLAMAAMRVSPANDIKNVIEIWTMLDSEPTVYVNSAIYRSTERENVKMMGIIAARAFAIRYPHLLGMAARIEDLNTEMAEWHSLQIQVGLEVLLLPDKAKVDGYDIQLRQKALMCLASSQPKFILAIAKKTTPEKQVLEKYVSEPKLFEFSNSCALWWPLNLWRSQRPQQRVEAIKKIIQEFLKQKHSQKEQEKLRMNQDARHSESQQKALPGAGHLVTIGNTYERAPGEVLSALLEQKGESAKVALALAEFSKHNFKAATVQNSTDVFVADAFTESGPFNKSTFLNVSIWQTLSTSEKQSVLWNFLTTSR